MKKVGISMSGGGAKGMIYLGLLKLLQERGVNLEVIGGLSAGALIAGLVAYGKTHKEIVDIAENLKLRELIDTNPFDGIEILDNEKVIKFLRNHIGDARIEELPQKLIIFATNLDTHHLKVITNGDLASAMVASCCLPPLFHPLRRDGELLAEGAFTVRFGAKYFREMGAEIVIGADVNGLQSIRLPDLVKDALNMFSATLERIAELENEYDPVDIKIDDFVDNIGMFEFTKMNHELVEVGYKTGLRYIDKIVDTVKR